MWYGCFKRKIYLFVHTYFSNLGESQTIIKTNFNKTFEYLIYNI